MHGPSPLSSVDFPFVILLDGLDNVSRLVLCHQPAGTSRSEQFNVCSELVRKIMVQTRHPQFYGRRCVFTVTVTGLNEMILFFSPVLSHVVVVVVAAVVV